ncbi:GNAT family N-acetyltransferase [Kribbella sp. NPDC023855]|uniref:GNAT family N-acetyltransferase n=1 Tax=Kribbella sp. NPDC023855 TaxID=3154698 RepID=UPI0033C03E95
MRATLTRSADQVSAAALIWAETTAARDGESVVPTLDEARPVIQAVIDSSPRSFLLMATDPAGTALGFAAVEPTQQPSVAELRYLGVRPRAWGRGVAQLLLNELAQQAKPLEFQTLQLSVYADNLRAVALYERLGWKPDGDPTPHPRHGRLEQRYLFTR